MVEKISYEQFEYLIDRIAEFVKEKDFKLDCIYGIPRGGLIVAVTLSHKLNLPLITSPEKAENKAIMVVDDIYDSGKTLKKLFDLYPHINCLIVATLVCRPQEDRQENKEPYPVLNVIPVDTYFMAPYQSHNWIQFPWETTNSSKYDGTL